MSNNMNSLQGTSLLAIVAVASVAALYHVSKPATGPTSSSTSRSMDLKSSSATEATPEDKISFWGNRWNKGDIAWHKTDVSAALKKYADVLFENIIGGGARVLVPLCGKTVDMEHLAMKRVVGEVVGIDGVEQAFTEYAAEHPDLEIAPSTETPNDDFGMWKGIKSTLLLGDFFNIDVKTAGGTFDAAWDRGSLVAIQPSLRDAYLQKISELMKPNGKILLSAYVRLNGDITTGPPFSIDEAEVRRLYEGKPWVESVELLETNSASSGYSWYKAISLYMTRGSCNEQIYLITTK
jgi:thiopurine S-methyltransferase